MQWKPVLTRTSRGGKYSAFADKLCVHVNVRGDMILSAKSFRAIGSPAFVQIVTDGNGRIGFIPGQKGKPCTYTIQGTGRGNPRRLAAKAVTNKFGLIEDRSKTYTLYIEEDALVFNLGQKPFYHD